MKKSILHVQLVNRPVARDGDAEDGPDGGRLDDRAESLVVVDAVALGEATNHPTRLVTGKGAVEWYLCLKIHLPVTMLAPSGRGTRRQVSLARSAWNSSAIAALQFGSANPLL